MTEGLQVVILAPGETKGRFDRELKAGSTETGGAYTLRVNGEMPIDRWIPQHIHLQHEESWYVLEGTLTFHIDGKTVEAPAGTFVLVPRGTLHGFGNGGPDRAGFLQVFSPGGMETYFEERGQLVQEGSASTVSDFINNPELNEALGRKYGMEFPHRSGQ